MATVFRTVPLREGKRSEPKSLAGAGKLPSCIGSCKCTQRSPEIRSDARQGAFRSIRGGLRYGAGSWTSHELAGRPGIGNIGPSFAGTVFHTARNDAGYGLLGDSCL